MKEESYTMSKSIFKVILFIFCFMSLYILTAPTEEAHAATGVTDMEVYTFNVGGGACSIVEFKLTNGGSAYILVDAGSKHITSDQTTQVKTNINRFIKAKGITKFKYVIMSHFDSDHVKLLSNIFESNSKLKVTQFVYRQYDNYTATYNKLTKAQTMEVPKTTETSAKVTLCNVMEGFNSLKSVIRELNDPKNDRLEKSSIFPYWGGETLTVGNNVPNANDSTKYDGVQVTLDFYNLEESYFENLDIKSSARNYPYDWRLASNDDSLVFIMKAYDLNHYNNEAYAKKILFCGDIQASAMKDLMSGKRSTAFNRDVKNCDLVFWPHHGCISGSELESIKEYIGEEFKYLPGVTKSIRSQFTSLLKRANGNTVSFVSTDKELEPDSKLDIDSLQNFKDGGYFTSYLVKPASINQPNDNYTARAHGLAMKFPLNASGTVYAFRTLSEASNDIRFLTTDKWNPEYYIPK